LDTASRLLIPKVCRGETVRLGIPSVAMPNVLEAHMANVERTLVAQSGIQSVAGHSLHKGTPREIFIREFLQNHLPANLAIGTGEIIDSESIPGAPRNQFDIVVYRRSFPKLHLGGGIDAFLIESVVATIEVKSTLTELPPVFLDSDLSNRRPSW
jgi:hypothetical protein